MAASSSDVLGAAGIDAGAVGGKGKSKGKFMDVD